MRKLLLILTFSWCFAAVGTAQVTAVMKVSAEVISGVNVQKASDLFISENSSKSHAGEIIINSSPSSDIQIITQENFTVKNSSGEIILIEADSLLDFNATTGTHSLKVNSQLPAANSIPGNYTGNMLTTIVYL
jgi:hypothetical protein